MCNLCQLFRRLELLPLASALLFAADADVDGCVQRCVVWTLAKLPCDNEVFAEGVTTFAITPGVCARLMSLLLKPDLRQLTLRVIGNICAGPQASTQAVVEAGTPAALLQLLRDPTCKKCVLRDCCFILSNIMAGDFRLPPRDMTRAVIQSGVMPFLVRLATDKSRRGIGDEAVWPVANAFISAYPEDVPTLIEQGCLRPLIATLAHSSDHHLIQSVVEALEALLESDPTEGLAKLRDASTIAAAASVTSRMHDELLEQRLLKLRRQLDDYTTAKYADALFDDCYMDEDGIWSLTDEDGTDEASAAVIRKKAMAVCQKEKEAS
eukprot:TRINITY_DN1714_c0_g1_i4.p1 TRINITY_DN1714_c0_g1~~TRINITY_DN1714_c0_g1_i4.p1  ORF type:complete len:323 (-),score=66.82 TRINITY_DN1714_c0_g1_i4:74-1042(-)